MSAWLTSRSLWLVGAGILLVVLFSLTVTQCSKRRSMAAQERVEDAQAGAAANSAADAIATVQRSGEATATSEELTRTNEREIRDAEGANDAVNAGVRDAGLASLCRRAAYLNHPKCKLRQPAP